MPSTRQDSQRHPLRAAERAATPSKVDNTASEPLEMAVLETLFSVHQSRSSVRP